MGVVTLLDIYRLLKQVLLDLVSINKSFQFLVMPILQKSQITTLV